MFKMPTEKDLNRIRMCYPAGTRVRLLSMNDPYSHLSEGDTGTIMGVDDAGSLLMRWDNGSTLSIILGEDRFECL